MNGSDAYDRCGYDSILHALPVGGLPISQDWLDRLKLVRNRTIQIILPSVKNILVDAMFKIIIGYTNLGLRQTQCKLGTFVSPSQSREIPASYCMKLPNILLDLVHLMKDRIDASVYLQIIIEIRDRYRDYNSIIQMIHGMGIMWLVL